MEIKVSDIAAEDLIRGYNFYESQEEGVGDYFLDSLLASIMKYVLILSLFLATSCATKPSGKVQAKSICIQISMALKVYYHDYGKHPVKTSAAVDFNENLRRILAGENPKKKEYWKITKDFYSPFGSKYYVKFAQTGNSVITPYGNISAQVAVWSDIPNEPNPATSWYTTAKSSKLRP